MHRITGSSRAMLQPLVASYEQFGMSDSPRTRFLCLWRLEKLASKERVSDSLFDKLMAGSSAGKMEQFFFPWQF